MRKKRRLSTNPKTVIRRQQRTFQQLRQAFDQLAGERTGLANTNSQLRAELEAERKTLATTKAAKDEVIRRLHLRCLLVVKVGRDVCNSLTVFAEEVAEQRNHLLSADPSQLPDVATGLRRILTSTRVADPDDPFATPELPNFDAELNLAMMAVMSQEVIERMTARESATQNRDTSSAAKPPPPATGAAEPPPTAQS